MVKTHYGQFISMFWLAGAMLNSMGQVSQGVVCASNHTLESDVTCSTFKPSIYRLSSQIFSLQTQALLKSSVFTFYILSAFQSSVLTKANLQTSQKNPFSPHS